MRSPARPFGKSGAPSRRASAIVRITFAGAFLTGAVLCGLNSGMAPAREEGPTRSQVQITLLRNGLGPTELTVAGVSPQGVGTVAATAAAYATTHWAELDAAQTRLDAARSELETVERAVRQGVASQEQRAEFPVAQDALTSAQSAFDAAIGALRQAALSGATDEQRTNLGRVLASSDRSVPFQYTVVEHSDADWVRLRDALANVRISLREGEPPDPECAAYVQMADADPGVAAAKTNLDSLAQAEAAWNDALGGR